MTVASLFSQFRSNLAVGNAADISTKYASITKRLNLDFWAIESDARTQSTFATTSNSIAR